MKNWRVHYLRVVLGYLLAGATMILVRKYPHYDGHPDVPFSGAIEVLIFAPFEPLKEIFYDFNFTQMVIFFFAFIFFYFILGKIRNVK